MTTLLQFEGAAETDYSATYISSFSSTEIILGRKKVPSARGEISLSLYKLLGNLFGN